jgi:hypothetical protein
MSWQPNEKEMKAVLSLPGAERYRYWIKHVCDEQTIWSLSKETGWALASDDQGRELVPVWPHPLFAEQCASGSWKGFHAKSVSMDIWLDRWIVGMKRDHRLVAVFPTPADKGVAVDPARIDEDLREELTQYE